MSKDIGRAPSGQALAVPAKPASGLDATRFDPSRDETVLLIADKDKPLAYLELDDVTLGRFARSHLIDTDRAAGWDAERREMPLIVSTAMHAKVALVRLFVAMFGQSDQVWESHCSDVTWEGEQGGGNWIITVRRARS